MATIEVARDQMVLNIPEEEILSVVEENGNFTITYDYDGEKRTGATFNAWGRDDVRALLTRRPELEKKTVVVESVPTAQAVVSAETPALLEEDRAVVSPTLAVNVQGERYYLAVNVQSHSAWNQCWREKPVRMRLKKLPTTEEVMVWNLKQCNARQQPDGSWSLPPRVTVGILEECLSFKVVKERPIPPDVDPLVDAHKRYSSNISGY